MKHAFTYFVLILFLVPGKTDAQVIDTTRRINTWQLMHNYSRFEDVNLDTTTHDLLSDFNPIHKTGTFYEHLGIIGNAARNLDFFSRPGNDHFLFGSALDPYLDNPDRTIFFNTRSPYSEIVYSNIIGVNWNEETVNFLHTQNMGAFTNFGVDLEILSGKELYSNEATRMSKFTLFGSRARDKYSAFGTVHYNNASNQENGGLLDIDGFRRDSIGQEPFFYDVNLENARSGFRNLAVFFTQKYMLFEKETLTDTLGNVTVTGKNLAINHQLHARRNTRFFSDDPDSVNIEDFYGNFYYLPGRDEAILDSAVLDQVSNTIQVILGDPYTDRLSARVYAGHELNSYGQLSPKIYSYLSRVDTVSTSPVVINPVLRDTSSGFFNRENFNELFVGFYMAGPPESKWYWYINGKYYLAGYYRNNFNINATFARSISEKLRLGLRGSIRNQNVSYFHNQYKSAYFQWDNDFAASQQIRGEAFIESSDGSLDVHFRTGLLTNYVYWDESAQPAQHDQVISITSGTLQSHLNSGGFHTINKLLVQYTTASDVLNLPLVALKTSNYYQRSFFDEALFAQAGFDLQITSKYRVSAYMPATGVFHLQDEKFRGGYPFLDLFLGIRINRTRIIGSLNNSLAPLLGRKYFSTYRYPGKPMYFRIGIAWTFYD